MSDAPTQAVRTQPWGRAVATALTCLALGPPIGAVVFTLSIMIYGYMGGDAVAAGSGFENLVASTGMVLLIAVPFSYVLGGLQALGTGIVFAVYGWLRKSLPWWLAVAAGSVMFVGMVLVGGIREANTYPLYFATHVASAVGCWLVVRNFWRFP